jgi:hypothetical protein
VQIGHEPVLGVVGAGHHLVLAVEGRDRRDGPEGFLAHDRGVVGHVGEHGRGEEQRPLAVARPARSVSAFTRSVKLLQNSS